ncbi:GNAT family N-acetyltransferase [Flavobacterium branchiarum]|uniref:GNAT family N-acetyltransferase n=1 Tax=Flavobacterium branchiarum TaxID=1114870 RepID=A0ABV5FI86_9FLAO|nr:GNAT family N-acetyltransferase [Flavobacterium branchiarum]MDN3674152.1 GNAT family N-acetyltransferase [Flavobacterium branchiarum]
MKNYTVKLYQEADYTKWNDFIGQAKNATFLFHRDFMEYHKDRLEDFSLLVYENEKLVSVLPANRVIDVVYSHQGLTYGGLVYSNKLKGTEVELILENLLSFFKEVGIKNFHYKPAPVFYFPEGNSEVEFFLFKRGALLERKEMNLAINLSVPLHISKSKLKHFRRIQEMDLDVIEENNFTSFWELVLEPRLLNKHNAKPVHNSQEIVLLKQHFSNNIKQFSAYYEGEIIAGITVFETDTVVKSQYGATTKKGEELRALDFLFINLIQKYKEEGKLFFDMGIVGDANEKGYNVGLLKQKEELGCSVYNQDFYKISL